MGDRWAWLHAAAAGLEAPPEVVRARVVAGLACSVAGRSGVRLPELHLLSSWGDPADVGVPDGVAADPWLLGEALEVLLASGERRSRGSHYTPRSLARRVTSLAFDGVAIGDRTTACDPAVGGGAFLLAAAEALVEAGLTRAGAVANLRGLDIDPVAVAVAEASLALWSGGRAGAELVVADALRRPPDDWGPPPTVVVGNPPFLGQLRSVTARAPDRSGMHDDLVAVAGPYTDTAALFAVLAVGLVAPGGRVALVLPRSFLAARDAGRARRAVLGTADLVHLWLPGRQVFGADVDVCVPVWARHGERVRGLPVFPGPTVAPVPTVPPDRPLPPIARSVGSPPRPAEPVHVPLSGRDGEATWSHLLNGLGPSLSAPSLEGLDAGGSLGDWCTATAGFRDQYYGLIPFTSDATGRERVDEGHAPLITSGLIDPAANAWGRRPTRYAGRRWAAPLVDVDALSAAGGPLARWADGKRVPKLLVAAQTRVVEAVVDVDGRWLPSTPVATVIAEPGRQWHALAVLLSPVATSWALHHHRGAALSGDAVRLSPAALRALPTPTGERHWDAAAAAVESATAAPSTSERVAGLVAAATAMCAAYGLDPEPLTTWWAARLPHTDRSGEGSV